MKEDVFLMGILRKPAAPPTLEEQQNAALALSASARSVFDDIKGDFAQAAAQHDAVGELTAAEVSRLSDLGNQARLEAERNRAAVTKLTELFG